MKKTITVLLGALILLISNFTFNTENCSAQWVLVYNGILNVDALAISGNNIYAGSFSPTPGGVYLSTNNGDNWSQTSISTGSIVSLSANGNNVFAGVGYPAYSGVFKSTDNGTTWNQTSLNNHGVYSLLINGNNIFAGTNLAPGSGVYKSTDNGSSWTLTSYNNHTVWSLAVNGNNIYAGTYLDGVNLSTDNGTSWTQIGMIGPSQNIYSLAINGNKIFAGTANPGNGVYFTTNNGANWAQTSLNAVVVSALAVSGNYIFAGNSGSVFASSDNGTSWIQWNEGLFTVGASAFLISNNYIFAGTPAGIFKRPISELTSIKSISNGVPQQFSLSQNYPNPFNPVTKINFNIAKTGFVKLTVFDALGREVETLVKQEMNAGSYNIDFNGSKIVSGVYFYRLQSADFTDVKKLVLLK